MFKSRMFRPLLASIVIATVLSPLAAVAQDRDPEFGHPPVGYDAAYDYVTHDYYVNYDGQRPQDPRAREQDGWRDGRAPIAPRTGYYAGVHIMPIYSGYYRGYGYGGYYAGCGCQTYGRRYVEYYDDYGRRGDSYPGRSYGRSYSSSYVRGYGYR